MSPLRGGNVGLPGVFVDEAGCPSLSGNVEGFLPLEQMGFQEVVVRLKTFENAGEMLRHIAESRKQADAAAENWQKDIKTGDFFLRILDELVIYGEVIKPDLSEFEKIPEGEMSDEMRMEYEWEKNAYKLPHMANMRFSRCFSQLCPEGEIGDTHVCNINAKITKEQFEKAKSLGWPSHPMKVFDILGINVPHLRE